MGRKKKQLEVSEVKEIEKLTVTWTSDSEINNVVNEEIVKVAEVIVTKKYFDTIFRTELPVGEGFECSVERAKQLTDAKVAKIICLKNSL